MIFCPMLCHEFHSRAIFLAEVADVASSFFPCKNANEAEHDVG